MIYRSKNGLLGWAERNALVGMLRARALAIAVFALAAVLSVVGLDILTPEDELPSLGMFGKKVEYLRRHHDRYNVLFVGTSTIYRSIDPVALREIAARRGCDVRAFNLGVSKLRLTELRHVRERLPASMLRDYDLIVLSPMTPSGIEVANWPSSRVQYFADWEGYVSSLVDIWEYPTDRQLKNLYFAVMLTGSHLYELLGIGQLTAGISGWPQAGAGNQTGDLFDGGAILDFSRHGFVALDDEPDEAFRRRADAITRNPAYFHKLKAESDDPGPYAGPVAQRAWRRVERSMDFFADIDVPKLIFLPPMVARRAEDRALTEHAAALGMPVLNYNQIHRYPELFDHRKWFDYYHVNQAGADAVTRLLGEDICSFIDKRGA
jgi:hypothetical protein